jgi:hypothetical protein
MPITLQITDNGDATGLATISGSTGGSTNTLYRAAWSASTGQVSWVSHGSRVGDGTIALTGEGIWIWKLENSVATDAEVTFQGISDTSSDSVMNRVMTAVVTAIEALSLSGVTNANIKKQWRPRLAEDDTAPLITVCPAPLPELMPSHLTGTDHIGYPVLVSILDHNNDDLDLNLQRNLLWRERIVSEFRHQGLSSVAEVLTCTVEHQAVINPSWYEKGVWYSAFVLRYLARVPRG